LNIEETIIKEGEEESYYSANEFEDSAIFEEVVEIGLSGEMIISEYVTEVLKVHDGNDYDDMPTELGPASDDDEFENKILVEREFETNAEEVVDDTTGISEQTEGSSLGEALMQVRQNYIREFGQSLGNQSSI